MKIINSDTVIVVDKDALFRDAFNDIMVKSPEELRKRLKIIYKQEEGIDAGGLLRYLLSLFLLNLK